MTTGWTGKSCDSLTLIDLQVCSENIESSSCVLPVQVQKPSNPWEFYINTQLNARVEPGARHLYNQLHAAHLFTNGSVLIGELHNCGTLLVRKLLTLLFT